VEPNKHWGLGGQSSALIVGEAAVDVRQVVLEECDSPHGGSHWLAVDVDSSNQRRRSVKTGMDPGPSASGEPIIATTGQRQAAHADSSRFDFRTIRDGGNPALLELPWLTIFKISDAGLKLRNGML